MAPLGRVEAWVYHWHLSFFCTSAFRLTYRLHTKRHASHLGKKLPAAEPAPAPHPGTKRGEKKTRRVCMFCTWAQTVGSTPGRGTHHPQTRALAATFVDTESRTMILAPVHHLCTSLTASRPRNVASQRPLQIGATPSCGGLAWLLTLQVRHCGNTISFPPRGPARPFNHRFSWDSTEKQLALTDGQYLVHERQVNPTSLPSSYRGARLVPCGGRSTSPIGRGTDEKPDQ